MPSKDVEQREVEEVDVSLLKLGAMAQAFSDVRSDIAELKEELKEHRSDLVDHNEKDIEVQTKIANACATVGQAVANLDKKLFGNGQPGEIASIKKDHNDLSEKMSKIENKLGVAVGGGIVIVFILEKFLDSIFK